MGLGKHASEGGKVQSVIMDLKKSEKGIIKHSMRTEKGDSGSPLLVQP